MFRNAVSNLGDPAMNPWPGWAIFTIGICTFGYLMVPHALYVYRKIATVKPNWARRFLVASLIGYAGHVGVGMFSEAPATFGPHLIAAAMAFGGLLSAAAFSWPPLAEFIKRSNLKHQRSSLIAMFVIMIVLTSTSFFMTLTGAILPTLRGFMDPGLLSMLFWEWMLVGSLAVHTFLLTAMVNVDFAS